MSDTTKMSKFEQKVVAYSKFVIRWRWVVIPLVIAFVAFAGSGARFIQFDNDYRYFFGKDNPQLIAFDALQDIYTKNDNVLIVLEPKDGDVFTNQTLAAVEELTEKAWQIPFAIRVDGLSNFQYTYADDDDLIVEDLYTDALSMTESELERAKEIALNETRLLGVVIPPDTKVVGVNVTFQFPGKDVAETFIVADYVRNLAKEIEASYPHIKTHLTGVVMLNHAFGEASQNDMSTLVPLMFLTILIVMAFLLRSVSGTFSTLLIIIFSIVTAMGFMGWLGIKLTGPSSSAPTMIMTLAVADSIHILIMILREMRNGSSNWDAITESLRVNMMPVFLTSLTTSIGFLSMNFSDVPPFHDLGNITTIGVVFAFIYSVLFLPAIIAVLPLRVKQQDKGGKLLFMERLAEFVIIRKTGLLWGSVVLVIALAMFIPKNELNDSFVKYFDERMVFRQDTDFVVDNLTGIYTIEYSLGAGESGGISNPDYLNKLEEFAEWYLAQPGVVHVYRLSETFKQLNKSMHGDNQEYYTIPVQRDLAAQYLLLYELSLPYGLDLNNSLNIDKSATRFTVILNDVSSREIRELASRSEEWLRDNAPEYMFSSGSGPMIMFAHISRKNINSMLIGTTVAIFVISIVLIVAMRSVKHGLISLLPNLVPAIMGFGVWGIFVGQIGMGLAMVTGMTLGIVVDDTVHFMSKYLRARREKNLSSEDAVRYAFTTVGTALFVTTVILVAGFGILSRSAFDLNSAMGKLTLITITFALITDFFLLPTLLMKIGKSKETEDTTENISQFDDGLQPVTANE